MEGAQVQDAQPQEADTQIPEPSPKKPKVENAFVAFMSAGTTEQAGPPTPVAQKETTKGKLMRELRAFAKEPQIDIKADPMLWWAERQKTYPLLSLIARKVLAIPASSAPTEFRVSSQSKGNGLI